MTKDEALKLALEWFEDVDEEPAYGVQGHQVIAAIKEALAQPEQEPVACIEYVPCCTDQTCPKCKATTLPQRTWVGLTDTEIKLQWSEFWETDCHAWSIEFAKAIEAKLKEKNT